MDLSKRDNVNVHRVAAKIIVFKNRAARGSVCNVLLSRVLRLGQQIIPSSLLFLGAKSGILANFVVISLRLHC